MRWTCRGGHNMQSSQLGQCCTREDTIPGGRDFHSGASEQYVLNNSLPLQAYPKHKPQRRSLTRFILSKSHAKTTHCPTPAKILFPGLYTLRIFSPQLFLEDFVINCAKNNPSGKDVVWLSEKAAHCLSKLCYQYLQQRDLSSELLMCEKPPVW